MWNVKKMLTISFPRVPGPHILFWFVLPTIHNQWETSYCRVPSDSPCYPGSCLHTSVEVTAPSPFRPHPNCRVHFTALSHVYLLPPPPLCPPLSSTLSQCLSFSLGSGIHRRSEDKTRALETTQHYHRHVGLWDRCCTHRGPRPRCLHQHQGWLRQMVGNCVHARQKVGNVCSSTSIEGLSSWQQTQWAHGESFQLLVHIWMV